jgi:hypothetical protein
MTPERCGFESRRALFFVFLGLFILPDFLIVLVEIFSFELKTFHNFMNWARGEQNTRNFHCHSEIEVEISP